MTKCGKSVADQQVLVVLVVVVRWRNPACHPGYRTHPPPYGLQPMKSFLGLVFTRRIWGSLRRLWLFLKWKLQSLLQHHVRPAKVQLAKAVYKAVNSLLPKSLCDLFRLTADVSHKHTRTRDSRCLFISQKLLSAHSSTEEPSCGILYQLRKEPFSHAIPSSRH